MTNDSTTPDTDQPVNEPTVSQATPTTDLQDAEANAFREDYQRIREAIGSVIVGVSILLLLVSVFLMSDSAKKAGKSR